MNVLVFVQLILRPTQDKNQEFLSAPILAVPMPLYEVQPFYYVYGKTR